MCTKADRCRTFTLPLPLLLLLPCYGRTTVMMVHVIGIVICCLLFVDDDDDVLLLAAAVAAVAAAYIGGNIILPTCTLPYLTSGRCITLHTVPLSCSVCSMSFFLFDDTIYE